MKIAGATALVTGANRGLGRHLAEQLVARGATVYATARRPETIDIPGAIPLALDVTDAGSVARAAEIATDVSILVNNAGTFTGGTFLGADTLDDIRLELDTHYFGSLRVTRAFAPSLIANHGALLNVLSAVSWVSPENMGPYAAAKSASWSLTNGLRNELAQGVQVSALHVGYMDTDMAAHVSDPKTDAAIVAEAALDGLEAGQVEIVVDETSAHVLAGLSGGVAALYPQFAPSAPTA